LRSRADSHPSRTIVVGIAADVWKVYHAQDKVKAVVESASSVKVVVLSACYSKVQAAALVEHVEVAVGNDRFNSR
jgi:hypothetical protein